MLNGIAIRDPLTRATLKDALAARLRAIAAGLMGALERYPDEPDFVGESAAH